MQCLFVWGCGFINSINRGRYVTILLNLGAWGALYAYTPEQYPTVIRGTGAGMAAAFGRIGGILGPLLVGYLVASEASLSLIFTIFVDQF